jgi:1,4-alpha-glucan branching enzyme
MARISVWAPNADGVEVEFFDLGAGQGRRVALGPAEGGWWWADGDAAPGTEYLLHLRAGDEELARIDPRAREVTNSVGRAVVTADPADHEWGDGGFVARPVNEWVIDEIHPGTFAGSLDAAADRLQHLADLGVTAVELMPVAEFAGDQSWGYNTALPFAVESSYGGPAAMRRFVETAHSLGMAVIVDVVYNHLGPSDLDLWRFDGWSQDGNGVEGGGIYFYGDWRAKTPWGATRPDYGRSEVRRFLIDNALMWIEEYHVDGLRLDSTVNIRNAHGYGGGDGDLEDGWSFLQELTSAVHERHPQAVLIAEDLQDDPRVTAPVAEGGLGFDLQWSAAFVHAVRAALVELSDEHRDLDAVAAAVIGGDDRAARVVYTESHDEVANGRTRVPAEIDPDDPTSAHAFRRSAAGAMLAIAAPGVPMLFQGQEWGDEEWFDDARDLAWERLAERQGIARLWGDLIRLRTGADDRAGGLRGDQVSCERVGPDGMVLVIRRWGIGGPASAAVAIVNLGATPADGIGLGFSGTGWRCVFSSDWAGYHESGSDSETLPAPDAAALPPYGAALMVPAAG